MIIINFYRFINATVEPILFHRRRFSLQYKRKRVIFFFFNHPRKKKSKDRKKFTVVAIHGGIFIVDNGYGICNSCLMGGPPPDSLHNVCSNKKLGRPGVGYIYFHYYKLQFNNEKNVCVCNVDT